MFPIVRPPTMVKVLEKCEHSGSTLGELGLDHASTTGIIIHLALAKPPM